MNAYLIQFINILVTVLYVAILARVLMSWFPAPSPGSPFAQIRQMVFQITEPILGPIRRLLPSMGMLDLSPMVAIILLIIAQRLLSAAL